MARWRVVDSRAVARGASARWRRCASTRSRRGNDAGCRHDGAHLDHRAAALRAASAIWSYPERRSEIAGPVAACGRDGESLAAEADLHAAEGLALLRVESVAVDQDWAAGKQSARWRDAIHELKAALQLVGYVGGVQAAALELDGCADQSAGRRGEQEEHAVATRAVEPVRGERLVGVDDEVRGGHAGQVHAAAAGAARGDEVIGADSRTEGVEEVSRHGPCRPRRRLPAGGSAGRRIGCRASRRRSRTLPVRCPRSRRTESP